MEGPYIKDSTLPTSIFWALLIFENILKYHYNLLEINLEFQPIKT